MPLTAEMRPKFTDVEHELIDITEYATPRLQFAGHELRCPDCKHPMHVVQALTRIAHFAHNPGRTSNCAISSGETIRHIYSKVAISAKLTSLEMYAGAEIKKEAWMSAIQRRADILVTYPDGAIEVHEIQLAAITVDELEERTNDYKEAGADEIIWWFGGFGDNQNNRTWAREKLGGYGILSITDSQERFL